MIISAKIIEDSVSPGGNHLTTLELSYPRFIHGEFMTHRVFSRNAMSSRAIPVAKMIDQVRDDPVVPMHWGANQPGMQARDEVAYPVMLEAIEVWHKAANDAANRAQQLVGLGIHKQIANRVLEPYQWMRTIVSATEWENFFALRNHKDAEPHFQLLAQAMVRAMDESQPVRRPNLPYDEVSWHLPYVTASERRTVNIKDLPKISAARCARVSYLTHDNEKPTLEADLALFKRLVGSVPMHASPVEHQACAGPLGFGASGNFVGWAQFRKGLELKNA